MGLNIYLVIQVEVKLKMQEKILFTTYLIELINWLNIIEPY